MKISCSLNMKIIYVNMKKNHIIAKSYWIMVHVYCFTGKLKHTLI